LAKQRPEYPPGYYPVLRYECNFGCAKCGVPIVTIHYIEGYEEGKVAPLKELIYLCKDHHDKANSGVITKQELYFLKRNPFNRDSVRHGFRVVRSKPMIVNIGGSRFTETPIPLELAGEPVISVRREGDVILFSVRLHDNTGDLRMEMIDNVWEADTASADVRYSEAEGVQAFLAIKLLDSEPYSEVKIIDDELYIKGNFYLRGNLLGVRDNGVFSRDKRATFSRVTMMDATVGISIS
jgi:hypothetical protein